MIPPDLVARLRMMVEADLLRPEPQVGGVERIRPIPERLPEVLPGQVLRATIQRPLPDGTFQAVVAGRDLTLALDQPVKSGDTLELVVERQVGGTIYARLNEGAAAAATGAGAASVRTQLSPTGELLRQVLTQPAPERLPLPADNAQTAPLLPAAPRSEADIPKLAAALQGTLQRSGLFYESHLAQWAQGNYPLEALRAEPQNVLTGREPASASLSPNAPAAERMPPSSLALPAEGAPAPLRQEGGVASAVAQGALRASPSPPEELETPAPAAATPQAEGARLAAAASIPAGAQEPAAGTPAAAVPPPALLAALAQQASVALIPSGAERVLAALFTGAMPAHAESEAPLPGAAAAVPAAASSSAAPAATLADEATPAGAEIPARLVPVVQHQLDALATQQLHVQFAPWPGWTVFWDLEAPQEREARSSPDEEEVPIWRSRLRLSLSALGDVEAELQWRSGTLEVRVSSPSDETSALLHAAAPALAARLEADGIRLTRLDVTTGGEREERGDGYGTGE